MFRSKLRILTSFLLFTAFFIVCAYNYDPDLGWHLVAGSYIVHNGIPAHDIFSYSAPSFEWINHEWLYSVFVSQLYSLGGELLLSAVIAAFWTLGVLLASRKYEPLILIAGGISLLSFVGVRPSVFALFFFVLLERILEHLEIKKLERKKYIIWFIPVLFLFWANIHGSFPLGFALVAYFVLNNKKVLPWHILGLAFIATFINPYGYKIYIEIFRTLSSNELSAYISEWKRFIIPVTYFFTIIPLLGIFLATEKKLVVKKYLVPFVLLLASINSMRFFLFFTASSLRYLEENFIYFKNGISQKFSKTGARYFYVLVLCSIFFVGVTHRVSSEIVYPVKAVEYLQTNKCAGNVFNFYDYGGYLIWKLPEQKVFIDGRMPTWRTSTENYMADYIRAINDQNFRKELFEKYSISCVLFPHKADLLISSLKQEGWVVKIDDGSSVLLNRQ